MQINTLLLADIFENFCNKCIETYGFNSAQFLSAPGLAWQGYLKKMEIGLELLTNTNGRKGTRDEICHTIHRYAKANNKYMKDYNKNKESSYLMYWDANNLYGWSMSQKLSVDNFEWEKNISKFD